MKKILICVYDKNFNENEKEIEIKYYNSQDIEIIFKEINTSFIKFIKETLKDPKIKMYDFLIFKSKFINFTSIDLLKKTLSMTQNQHLIAVRHDYINIKNPIHSPRLPFIDNNIFFINIKNKNFNFLIDNFAIKYSNIDAYLGISSEMINFIEYNFKENEILNLNFNNNFNEFGEKQIVLNPYPFNYCKSTGLVVILKDYSKNFQKIYYNLFLSRNINDNFKINFLKYNFLIILLRKIIKIFNSYIKINFITIDDVKKVKNKDDVNHSKSK